MSFTSLFPYTICLGLIVGESFFKDKFYLFVKRLTLSISLKIYHFIFYVHVEYFFILIFGSSWCFRNGVLFAKMGAFFSCPFARYVDVENGLESITVKSISFGDDEVKTPVRSVSFNGRDLEPMIMKSVGSGRMMLETSVSFKGRELEKMVSMEGVAVPQEEELNVVAKSPKSKEMEKEIQSPRSESHDGIQTTTDLGPTNPEHIAAMKLQKVYKSFRTRRKLADCAVLVEQSWYVFCPVSLF